MKPTFIANGVDGLFVENRRFNTTLVSFNFYLPLSVEDVSQNALLPYVLTSCSEKYKTFTELNMALNMLYGAGLSVSVSKIGDAQLLKIAISVINDEFSLDGEPVIKKATELLMDLIFEPKVSNGEFYSEDVEREKRKAREHILGEINDKRLYARKKLISEMFEGTPYAVSVYGTTELLDKVDGKSLYAAWQNMLSTAFVRVQLVGKTLPDGFFESVSSKFSKYSRKVNNDYKTLTALKNREEVKTVTERLDVAQGKLVMGFSSKTWGNDAYALTVATDIFGGGTYSGLFANVREKLSLCYYCSASANKNKGYIMVDSGVEFANAKLAKEEILNQLKLVQNGEFDTSVFAASKKNILNSLNSSYDSLGALDNWYCTNIFSSSIKTPEEVGKIITALTLEEVIAAARGIKLNTVYMLLGREGEQMKTQIFKNDIIKENYSLTVLDNGLKIYIMEKPEFNTVYTVFGTKYGSIDTAFSLNGGDIVTVPEGIAHFLEHKLFESEDGDAFTKYAKTGAYANAFTSFDKTCYLFSCSSMFYENLDILLDFVQSPYFTAATVEKEQGIIGQEIRMYDDSPSWCVLFNTLRAMYHNNPVKIDIAGTVKSIAQIDDKLLYECYNTFYNPSNMFVCIAGNIDTEKVLEKISASVKSNTPVKIERVIPDEPEAVVSRYIEKQLDVAMPLFCFGYKLALKREPTLFDTVCFDVLLKIISSDITPLYKKLTDEKLINDEFDGEFFTGRGYAALLFDGESANPERVADYIKAEIARLKKEGIDEICFEAVKRDIYGGVVKRYNSVEDIVMSFIDSAVCDYNSFDEIEIIKNLTKEDIERYLDTLNEENTVLSVISPR